MKLYKVYTLYMLQEKETQRHKFIKEKCLLYFTLMLIIYFMDDIS